ncbi:MAG: hypothetical protein Q8R37_01540 [Nanoarchaeota archaeon]|nr:hypothetical protein [Nanoarchaeota archaeon]
MEYQIPLLILEENVLQEVPLMEVYVTPSGLDHVVSIDTFEKHWPQKETQYGPYMLADDFISTVTQLNTLFAPLVAEKEDYNLLEKMLATKVTFAVENAYRRKRLEENTPVEEQSLGAFYEKEGILLLLQKSLIELNGTVIHEFGHALHKILTPDAYYKSNDVMKEIIAIHLQRHYGVKRNYAMKPHSVAVAPLENLESTDFQKQRFEQRWELLTSLVNHNPLLFAAQENKP